MTTIRFHPSGKEIPCEEGDTVLATLERHGYALPNNCRAGACGECKCKVVSGEFDQGLVMDMALSEEERADGYGLMCMAKPTSAVLEVEFGTDDAQPKLFPPRENMPYVVVDRISRTPRIIELRLRPLGDPMRFWPGQYVTLGDPAQDIPPRCYSIANIPNRLGEIALQITRVEGGRTSAWAHDRVEAGDAISISGPYGTFIGDPTAETPVLCLAAGSGLAPITSLASAAFLRGGFRYPAALIFSAPARADLYEIGLYRYLEAKFRNFRLHYTLTREDNPGGLTGRIPLILPGLFPDLSAHSLYIAGSPEFVEDCAAAAIALGAVKERIHTEGFFEQSAPETPPKERLLSAPTG
jgi:CDP-4-dehydro-6-deoxyglucose reductase